VTKRPRRLKADAMAALSAATSVDAGTVLASGCVPGRPVPWKAPPIIVAKGKRGVAHWDRGYKSYCDWLTQVRTFAAFSRRRQGIYGGPVILKATFYACPKGTPPDTTNLLKAFEDGLQGVLIQDDVQVVEAHVARVLSRTEPQRVEFELIAAAVVAEAEAA
jgi:Holliday junction resolvase RusA-like endonuclease